MPVADAGEGSGGGTTTTPSNDNGGSGSSDSGLDTGTGTGTGTGAGAGAGADEGTSLGSETDGVSKPPDAFFTDDFLSGDLSKTENGFRWAGGNGDEPVVSTGNSKSDTYSLKYIFVAVPNDDVSPRSADSFSEERFQMDDGHEQLHVGFDLFVPNNYAHRSQVGGDNNKFIRLWRTEAGGNMRFGLSLRAGEGHVNSGISWMLAEYNVGGVQQSGTIAEDFITAADLGAWMKIDMNFRNASAAGASDGLIQLWKNDVFMGEFAGLDTWHDNEPQSFTAGYLLGWANSGFDELTEIYMDNVIFSDTLYR